ncbi:MAG: type III-A CRISPR-associated protein Csm2 [Chloroflexi bacterium]|nr:type III-A CRISPR-associated protein Csm2 [Chloroflexota bacterium]
MVEEAISKAREIGQKQGQAELKASQLRRFYGKAKNIEQKLDSGQSFNGVRAEILTLQPIAANTVARGNAADVFKEFIDRNVALAAKDEKHFRQGFLVHFQSVVAFFTYIYRR